MNQNNQFNLPNFLNNFYIILCHTSHPGNIGSAARAMKTMGLTNLILVAPNIMATSITHHPPQFDPNNIDDFSIPDESFALASGAKDILNNAKIFASLKEAIQPMHIACALSSRKREITAPFQTPQEIMPELIEYAQQEQKIAFVLGSETFGLSIEDVSLCNQLITINGNPQYFSLNLAQAVQIISYELFKQLNQPMSLLRDKKKLATRQEISGLITHLENTMNQLGFFEKRNKDRLLRRLQRMTDKANMEHEEIDILRGFLTLINKKLNKCP